MGGISIFYFPFDFDRGRLYTIENTILLTPLPPKDGQNKNGVVFGRILFVTIPVDSESQVLSDNIQTLKLLTEILSF